MNRFYTLMTSDPSFIALVVMLVVGALVALIR